MLILWGGLYARHPWAATSRRNPPQPSHLRALPPALAHRGSDGSGGGQPNWPPRLITWPHEIPASPATAPTLAPGHPAARHLEPSSNRERRMTLDPIFVAIRGRVGDIVYKTYRDQVVTTRVPRFDGYVPSAAQRVQRDRMQAATAYARRVYADPLAKAAYVAA
eukprot:gene10051-13539_t